jgi:hypothetical protein
MSFENIITNVKNDLSNTIKFIFSSINFIINFLLFRLFICIIFCFFSLILLLISLFILIQNYNIILIIYGLSVCITFIFVLNETPQKNIGECETNNVIFFIINVILIFYDIKIDIILSFISCILIGLFVILTYCFDYEK